MKNVFALLSFTAALAAMPMAAQAEPQMPSQEALQEAIALINTMQAQVQDLIVKGQGGGGGSTQPPASCQQIRDQRSCMADEDCQWIGRGQRGYCATRQQPPPSLRHADAMVPENDNAAEFALEGLGSGLTQLGNLVDQANQAWGTPQFWWPWQQACGKDNWLEHATQAARVTANLPAQGFISPADFDPIAQELDAVHQTLLCP